MQNILLGLLVALFYSSFAHAEYVEYDVSDPKGATYKKAYHARYANKEYAVGSSRLQATNIAAPKLASELSANCQDKSCSYTIDYYIADSAVSMCKNWVETVLWDSSKNPPEYKDVSKKSCGYNFNFSFVEEPNVPFCPPDSFPEYIHGPFDNPDPNGALKVCYKPMPPLDCTGLNGLGTSGLTDSFTTLNSAGYSKTNPPNCVTRCAADESGQTRCGNCQVIAKSWISTVGATKTTWEPLIGTFTGGACGENEANQAPTDKPSCFQSKNGLYMCQAKPEEQCQVVNGVEQCAAGCGYINGDFWCIKSPDEPPPLKPKDHSDDKPIDAPNDTITDPTRALADMTKQDFKDVNVGVESRLVNVVTAIENNEASVDTTNQLLDKISGQLDGIRNDYDSDGALAAIRDNTAKIAENTNGTGTGDGAGDGEPCLPNSDCNGASLTGPHSWWTPIYPEGAIGIFNAHKEEFLQSPAYQAMGGNGLADSSGSIPVWNICFDTGIVNLGCKELSIPENIWTFLKLIMLFTASIYCRSLIIGK